MAKLLIDIKKHNIAKLINNKHYEKIINDTGKVLGNKSERKAENIK